MFQEDLMFKEVSYRKKFFAVIFGFVILLLAVYKKNFKNILDSRAQLKEINKKLTNVDNSYNEIFFLKNNIKQLDNIIGGQSSNPEQVQQLILDYVSSTTYNVDLHRIEDTHIVNDSEFLIHTNILEIEGDYKSLIQLLYEIEQKFEASKVVSSNFYSIRNYRTNKRRLFLKLILQNYERHI